MEMQLQLIYGTHIWRSTIQVARFQSLISRNGAKLGLMLLLTINRKPYMASPMTPWHLTLSDIETSVKVTQILNPYIS